MQFWCFLAIFKNTQNFFGIIVCLQPTPPPTHTHQRAVSGIPTCSVVWRFGEIHRLGGGGCSSKLNPSQKQSLPPPPSHSSILGTKNKVTHSKSSASQRHPVKSAQVVWVPCSHSASTKNKVNILTTCIRHLNDFTSVSTNSPISYASSASVSSSSVSTSSVSKASGASCWHSKKIFFDLKKTCFDGFWMTESIYFGFIFINCPVTSSSCYTVSFGFIFTWYYSNKTNCGKLKYGSSHQETNREKKNQNRNFRRKLKAIRKP